MDYFKDFSKLTCKLIVVLFLFSGISLGIENEEKESSIDSLVQEDSTIENQYFEPLIDTTIVIPLVDFRNTKVIDILSVLAKSNKLNVWLDPSIDNITTVYFENIKLNDLLEFFISEYSLTYEKHDGLLKILKSEPIQPAPPEQVITYEKGKLTIDVTDIDIGVFARNLVTASGKNVIVKKDTKGRLSGFIKETDFEGGLTGLLLSNGFSFEKKGEMFFIGKRDIKKTGEIIYIPGGITVEEGLISLNVDESDLKSLIDEIGRKAGLQLVLYGDIKGNVSARCNKLFPDEVFRYILRGTNLTYKKENEIFFIGPKDMPELSSSKLIELKHLMASNIIDKLPQSLTTKATIKVINEHNAVMVIGPEEFVSEIERYIDKLDYPPAQVLIEALVVDYIFTDHYQFGINARSFPFRDSASGGDYFYPEVDYEADSDILNKRIRELADELSITNVGQLPGNFYVKLNALSREGRANIKSRPTISTLNGHEAKIDIGTTQYYLLRSETTYGVGQQTPTTQVTEKFETIEASMSLVITPWVTASKEIIVNIHPEFNTPQGNFNPDVPPTINHRVLDSNVRLKDGETIVLGGLIQTSENITDEKFPILGDIPILGWLFRNRTKTKVNSELVIYLTPHIYYGSEGAVDISEYED